jgi:nitrous oxide reductase
MTCPYLLADPLQPASSGRTPNARQSCRRTLLLPVIVVAVAPASAQSSALNVIELYQGLARAFQRWGKSYEFRCGQLYACTIAASADRQ